MNKKECIAYGQVTLEFMQSSKYEGEINPDTFAVEMKQAFKLYPKSNIFAVADAQKYARDKLKALKNEI